VCLGARTGDDWRRLLREQRAAWRLGGGRRGVALRLGAGVGVDGRQQPPAAALERGGRAPPAPPRIPSPLARVPDALRNLRGQVSRARLNVKGVIQRHGTNSLMATSERRARLCPPRRSPCAVSLPSRPPASVHKLCMRQPTHTSVAAMTCCWLEPRRAGSRQGSDPRHNLPFSLLLLVRARERTSMAPTNATLASAPTASAATPRRAASSGPAPAAETALRGSPRRAAGAQRGAVAAAADGGGAASARRRPAPCGCQVEVDAALPSSSERASMCGLAQAHAPNCEACIYQNKRAAVISQRQLGCVRRLHTARGHHRLTA